jgi:hypothetical protein
MAATGTGLTITSPCYHRVLLAPHGARAISAADNARLINRSPTACRQRSVPPLVRGADT